MGNIGVNDGRLGCIMGDFWVPSGICGGCLMKVFRRGRYFGCLMVDIFSMQWEMFGCAVGDFSWKTFVIEACFWTDKSPPLGHSNLPFVFRKHSDRVTEEDGLSNRSSLCVFNNAHEV